MFYNDYERRNTMQSKDKETASTPYLTRGSVLEDLGFNRSEVLEITVKIDIYRELMQYIKHRKYTQQQLGELLGIHQPDVSNLINGKISKFSITKFIKFAGKLNLGARIELTQQPVARLPRATVTSKTQKRVPTLV